MVFFPHNISEALFYIKQSRVESFPEPGMNITSHYSENTGFHCRPCLNMNALLGFSWVLEILFIIFDAVLLIFEGLALNKRLLMSCEL